MATFLYRLGRLSFRRRRWVALIWVALLFAVSFAAATAEGNAEDDFALPGTEAQQAFDLMEEAFPEANAESISARLVFRAPDGEEIIAPDHQAVVEDVLGRMAEGDRVLAVSDPFEHGGLSADGTIAYATVDYRATWTDITEDMREHLFDTMDAGRDAGLEVEAGGEIAMGEPDFGEGEIIGIGVAALVLLITFGSLVAAGLPLVTALVGVGTGMAGITALAAVAGLSEMTGVLAMMIGLAVGIDYALFIASRYRSELIEGHSREEAVGRAAGTAGSAVVFAGATVIIALAGLAIVNVPLLTKMGLAAAATVAIAVLIALTLVPAALGFAGKRIFGKRARQSNPATGVPLTLNKNGKENHGSRWARMVLRRPVLVLAACVVGLGALALPVADLELGLPDDGTQPVDTTQRKAYDMLSDGFGAGFNGPLMLVLDAREAADPQGAAETVSAGVEQLDGVLAMAPPRFNEAGTVATVIAFPASGPADPATADLVADLRGSVIPPLEEETGAEVFVSGQTAVEGDFSTVMTDALVPYLTLVVGLAFILLMLVFRSVLVPLKAALGFLFSVLAALGAVVAVFQWGWLAGLIGVSETGPIMSMMPIFMIGVIFGLAMDYEVFLVTRMREAHVHGEDSHQSVISGFNLNARVVTAAAIIMISVFAGFITAHEAMVKMMGFGLAMAILIDAFVVRMTLVPAVLGLLGEKAWWLPRWLDRILPDVDVEGAKLERYLEAEGRGRETVRAEREPATVGS
ncbi:MMPL family transporter [Streptomyces sodiiphilus]|uniref:MMPL family transporter n=1 Tax=Streptomyces sodiiphilus TaxID=226217 RepID=A0ABN2PA24_9ACTN